MKKLETSKNIVKITKEQAKEGITLKLKRDQIVIVAGWRNKHGTNVLFRCITSGIYKVKGDIDDFRDEREDS